MSRTAKIRAAAWLVVVVCLGVFLALIQATPSGPIATRDLLIVVLPHQIASVALLVLFWVGAFPESWPLMGGSNRFGRFLFWFTASAFAAFWLFFYARFIFHVL